MHSRSARSVVPVKQILLVDDTPSSLNIIRDALEYQGYEVAIAQSGREALIIISQSPPDLILIDVVMPEMDGYEVTRQIHENSQLPFIPIVLITAYEYTLMDALDAGAIDILEKSGRLDELVARVANLLTVKQTWDDQVQIHEEQALMLVGLTHDLRSPLIAASQVLEQIQVGTFGNTLTELQPPLAQVKSNNQTLINLVETALEAYQYNTHNKTFAFLPVDLTELSREVLAELRSLATSKGLDLRLSSSETIEILGDRLELQRLLINLVSNAIQFTETGFVEVQLRQTANEDGVGRAIIEVIDTGIGFSESEQAKLFQRFISTQNSRSLSGLGLYLCQQIVEAHQGSIHVQSTSSQGTTFLVDLPAIAKR
ncbi:MAG: hybrid sensor histidine kinase/response regulator [Leptolyngbya sp. UWPOB_LEPTO1]|uniref:hybrid sensor histidine kinase/response regulator n=1 Tax=Leptolyngbya sp. UWPOB_LEPTO1 TaxID=2815653 RepID=UPI001ACE8B1D|nr:hybrid sensor histidine kinase/response regulator [Leptolyngbya sp. UWPOB_LEPTO1]MBN8563464.1 hybrid sensor histidine kinase/response regulator [Leptolyngbya sp. UWPOB_LEPTO1]